MWQAVRKHEDLLKGERSGVYGGHQYRRGGEGAMRRSAKWGRKYGGGAVGKEGGGNGLIR